MNGTFITFLSDGNKSLSLAGALESLSPSDFRSNIDANLARIESGRTNELVHSTITGTLPSEYTEFITSFGYDLSYRYLVRNTHNIKAKDKPKSRLYIFFSFAK